MIFIFMDKVAANDLWRMQLAVLPTRGLPAAPQPVPVLMGTVLPIPPASLALPGAVPGAVPVVPGAVLAVPGVVPAVPGAVPAVQ